MARPVRVVTDSTTDFTVEQAAQLDVIVVPLLVRFGDETFEDRVTLPTSEFYERLRQTSVTPSTSQPAPAAFLAAYRPLLDEGADIISLHISAALSGTYNSANVAREQVDPARIATVDTRQASFGAQTLVREAVRAAREGQSLAEIVARMETLKPNVHIVATVETLEFLRRNGRIGRVSAILGGLMALKVLITVTDGVVVPLDKVRTRARSLQRVQQLIAEGAPFYGPVLVGHTHDPAAGEALVAALQARFPEQEVILCEVGPAIGSHAGPGTVGAGFITMR
ncbi:MAG: DegV family protein [Chloroflexota bacterium]